MFFSNEEIGATELTEITDLSRDIKRLRDEMDDAKSKLESLETAAAKLAGRADQTDSRLEKIETNARHFKMR
jgi:phage host-nuclease inhibitor protein Gam